MKHTVRLRRLAGLCMALALCVLTALPLAAQDKPGKKNKGAPPASETPKPPPAPPVNKDSIMPYPKVITSKAVTDTGLFITHRVGAKWYFEVPDSLLNREILVVSRMSGTVDGLTFGGAGMTTRPEQVIRWHKQGDLLLLRSVSYNNVATEDKPIYESVRNNNFEPIIMSFPIKALGKDSSGYVIEVGKLFTTDVPMIGPLDDGLRKSLEVKGIDPERSLVMRMKSFPLNTEVRHVLTYNVGKLPSGAPTGVLSLEMNQSFVLLPREPMMPRMYDPRVGYFSIRQLDYGLDEQKAATRQYITRWRLEPKDPEAFRRGELVEPVKQIVYYVDPATPIEWRPYLKQGVEDWQKAFEAAGFKNAIIAKDPPSPEEDPDWSPEDVRYSVIRYISTPIENAVGPHVHDPRSGEIIESDILWYHNVMNLLRNWFFVQTAAANPQARSPKFDREVMGQLIRFVAAHEVGHTLGLPHNMGASSAYPVDSLRSASFTRRMGTAPSIMDYARFNYIAQPEDQGVSFFPGIGVYDKWSIEWGYKPIPGASTPEAEKETLNRWILSHAGDRNYRFGRQMATPLDPSAQTEDLGDDAMKASTYGIANLKRIMGSLVQWTTQPGEDYKNLDELYDQVLGQWNRYMGHVRTNVGGVYYDPKTADQPGMVYTHVPKATQQAALAFLNRELFKTPVWVLDENILRRIESAGIVDRVRSLQAATLNTLLEPSRLARLIENEALNGSEAYTMVDLCNDLRGGIWSELNTRESIDTYRRNLQRAHIERLEYLLTQDSGNAGSPALSEFFAFTPIDVSQSDIRAIARAELKLLDGMIRKALPTARDSMTRYHLEELIARIDVILNPGK
ncbi:MAG: zinc-dependent metalloprotease [Bacteroidia bacterium]|nr:zinc-dependent metalloprotease [Bacteroidia bacterium]